MTVPNLSQVSFIRKAVIRTQQHALSRLAYFLSTTTNGREMADIVRPPQGTDSDIVKMLQGEHGDSLIAKICDLILEALGHEVEVKAGTSNGRHQSKSERAVRGGTGRSMRASGRTSKAMRGAH